MINKESIYQSTRTANSTFVVVLYFSVLIFQLTSLKFLWGLETLSRLANITMLVWANVYCINSYIKNSYNSNVYTLYVLPGFLVYFGYFLNVTISSISDIGIVNQFGLTLPWVMYLTVPQLMKKGVLHSEELWHYFYYFMTIAMSLSFVEYALVFNGNLGLHEVMTDGGLYLAAWFTKFHGLSDGEIHYRFYSCFPEPGTLAMYLLPAIAYAFYYKKYFGLILFILALVLTDSLGGFAGFAMLVPLLMYTYLKQRKINPTMVFAVLFAFLTLFAIYFSQDFIDRYERKNRSATIREENTFNTFSNLPHLMFNYPMGFPLKSSTELAMDNRDYLGSNFTPGYALTLGGIGAFFGYFIVLFVSLGIAIKNFFRPNLSREGKVVFVSIIVLIPFIFQRAVIWDGVLFSFLFAPTLINCLRSPKFILKN